MKRSLLVFSILMSSYSSFAKDVKPISGRTPASEAECLAANKTLAESILKNAAKRIGFQGTEVATVKLDWISATDDRFVFSGSIYKANYEIVVKTDSSCFPREVELIDTARK